MSAGRRCRHLSPRWIRPARYEHSLAADGLTHDSPRRNRLPPAIDRAGLLDRALRALCRVRAGEGGTALLLALNVLLLLAAYYFIKPVREALILAGEGAEVKSYAAAGQALLLLGLVPAYGRWPTGCPGAGC